MKKNTQTANVELANTSIIEKENTQIQESKDVIDTTEKVQSVDARIVDVTSLIRVMDNATYDSIGKTYIEVPLLTPGLGMRQSVINLIRGLLTDVDYSRWNTARTVQVLVRFFSKSEDGFSMTPVTRKIVLKDNWYSIDPTKDLINILRANLGVKFDLPVDYQLIESAVIQDLLTLRSSSSDKSLINQLFLSYYSNGKASFINAIAEESFNASLVVLKTLFTLRTGFSMTNLKLGVNAVEFEDIVAKSYKGIDDFVAKNYELLSKLVGIKQMEEVKSFVPANANTPVKSESQIWVDDIMYSPYYDSLIFSSPRVYKMFVSLFLTTFYLRLHDCAPFVVTKNNPRSISLTLKGIDVNFESELLPTDDISKGLDALVDGLSYKKPKKASNTNENEDLTVSSKEQEGDCSEDLESKLDSLADKLDE